MACPTRRRWDLPTGNGRGVSDRIAHQLVPDLTRGPGVPRWQNDMAPVGNRVGGAGRTPSVGRPPPSSWFPQQPPPTTPGIPARIGFTPLIAPDRPETGPESLAFAASCAMVQHGRLSRECSFSIRLNDTPEPSDRARDGRRPWSGRRWNACPASPPWMAPRIVPIRSLGREGTPAPRTRSERTHRAWVAGGGWCVAGQRPARIRQNEVTMIRVGAMV